MKGQHNDSAVTWKERAASALSGSRHTVSVKYGRYRALKWCLTGLVVFSAVPSSLEENALHPALLLALLVAAAALLRPDYRRAFFWSEGVFTGLFVAYIPAFLAHLWSLNEPVTPPLFLVYFTFGTLIVRCLAPLTDRNLMQLIVLSVGLVLINCIISNHLIFGIILPFYLFSLMGTLGLFHVARSAEASDATEQISTIEKDSSTLRGRLARSAGLIVILAALLFILFPRPFAALPGLRAGVAGGTRIDLRPASRYSDMATMIGRNRIAFAVKFEDRIPTGPVYWRGTVLEKTDGLDWSSAGFRWPAGYLIKPGTSPEIEYIITPYRLKSNIIYAFGTPLRVRGRGGRAIGINSRGEAIIRSIHLVNDYYSVEAALAPIPTARDSEPINSDQTGVTARIRSLALAWTRNATTPGDKTVAIMNRLRDGYTYQLQPDPAPEGTHPTEHFLFTARTGNCEQFSRAMTLMMRSLNIPARVVEGFSGMEKTDKKDEFIVRFARAHAWVECDLGGGVWQSCDPTPRGDLELYSGIWGRLADMYDALQIQWIRTVVNFDRSDQLVISRGLRDFLTGRTRVPIPWLNRPRDLLLAIAILVAAAAVVARLVRRRKNTRYKASAVYFATMEELVRLTALGQVHPWHEQNLAEAGEVVPQAREDLERFTNAYLALRFGGGDAQSWNALHAAREDLLRRVFAARKSLKKVA